MSSPDTLARALALAFLAGPWTRARLVERGEQVLGERPRWLTGLAREILGQFGEAPNDADRTLREAIERARSFKRGMAPGKARSRIHTLLVSEPSMGIRRWPVPELCTTPDVASWLEIAPSELDWFADVRGLNGEVAIPALLHYAFKWRPKRRGGHRLLEAPKTRLKALQRRILQDILRQVPIHDAAHGFVSGRSALTCARVHEGRNVVLRMDLEDYFPSIGAARVYRLFRSVGYPEAVAQVLTGLCTLKVSARVLGTMPCLSFVEQYDPRALATRARIRHRLRHRHLAQGAPTSAKRPSPHARAPRSNLDQRREAWPCEPKSRRQPPLSRITARSSCVGRADEPRSRAKVAQPAQGMRGTVSRALAVSGSTSHVEGRAQPSRAKASPHATSRRSNPNDIAVYSPRCAPAQLRMKTRS